MKENQVNKNTNKNKVIGIKKSNIDNDYVINIITETIPATLIIIPLPILYQVHSIIITAQLIEKH